MKEPEPVPFQENAGSERRARHQDLQPDEYFTCLNNTASGTNREPSGNKGNVCKVQNLGAMREGKGPELGGRAENVDETLAIAGGDLGAVRNAD